MDLRAAEDFHYSNQGGVFTLREMDDVEEFDNLQRALNTLNFSSEEAQAVISVSAGLLHLGEIMVLSEVTGEGEGSKLDPKAEDEARTFCRLGGLNFDQLVTAMTTKTVETRFDRITTRLRPQLALDARDALAKSLYSRLFDYLVKKININLVCDRSLVEESVSVLDIFGFECFKLNSFEQLCINYTNEKLQQQFNLFVFKMEQAEYEREGIEWSFNDFPDNQDCLDLIEGRKPDGILAMLDDECSNPNGNDQNFASRLYKEFNQGGGKHHRFHADKRMV